MAQWYSQPQQPALARCYRHQDQETGVRCARCDRPICPACMVPAAVGYQCPECAGGAAAARANRATRPRTITGAALTANTRVVTSVLLALNLVVFVAVLAGGDDLVLDLSLLGHAQEWYTWEWRGVADGEWYRLLTSAFLHQEIWHIAFNMLGLWFLGPQLEAALGRVRFTALYLISALGGSTLFYVLAPQNESALGASGAIFGLFGATAVLARRLRMEMRPILTLLAVNLVITFVMSGIAWQAHIGGLVAGAAVTFGMVHAPRKGRLLVQAGTCAVVLAVLLTAIALRTSALLGS
ncbi:rhomboid family intramembrane serine protease [Streptomyces sp. RFCAC02]|uniref:rhomboid family intramembrane serine protease n=1 Tax=Streptomyces sp. RFCAC02 TaxID=2499143 RepID=UPI001020832A|nr:rhomboid family intramembrane serine protease [Streptomyces sp. RFCAC02]